MANYKEEHIRNNRRLARQIVGGVALLLAVIGLFTVFGWVVSLLRSVLDDSDRRKAYEDRLFGMVMLDPLAFSDVSSVDPGVFKQAAIWGTVYQVQNSGGNLDQYERDPDTGSAIIPKLEIDTYIANLLGPDYTVDDGSFSTDVFSYQYDEEKQGYLVPVTSSVAQYTPEVEKIWKADGKQYVTVGYIPTATNSSSNATPAPTANVPQDAQSMVEDQLGNAMADTSTVLNDDAASDTSAEEDTSADSEDAPAEDGGEDSADSESAAE